ncbi:HAMP domain-containing protein [bacterium]|nr:HAMP domain-containing protein [bacterium]
MSFYKNHRTFVLLGLLVFMLGLVSNPLEQGLYSVHLSLVKKNFESNVLKAEKTALQLLDDLVNEQMDYDELTAKYRADEDLGFYIYHGDSLKEWYNIHTLPPYYFTEFYRPTYQKTKNGGYVFFVKSKENQHWVVAFPLVHSYYLKNNYLQENSPLYAKAAEHFEIGKPGEFAEKISLSTGQEIGSLRAKDSHRGSHNVGNLVFVALLLMVLFVRQPATGMLAYTALLYLLLRSLGSFCSLNATQFYNPALYSGAFILSNLGDLLMGSLLLLTWLIDLKNATLKMLASYLVSILMAIICFDLIENSVITIDTSDILNLSGWSFFVYLILSVLLFRTVSLAGAHFVRFELVTALLSVVLAALLCLLLHIPYVCLLFPLALFAGKLLVKATHPYISQHAVVLVVVLLSALFVMVKTETEKIAREQLPLVVKNLINQRDNVAEFLLNDFRLNLEKDAYVKSFFTNPFLPKSAIEERLEKLYLRGYLKKYEHKILFLPKKLKFGYTPDRDLAETINSILKEGSNQLTRGIYATKLTGITNAYLTEQSYVQDADTVGSLYVLLTEKSFYDQSIYPELLVGNNAHDLTEGYTYALYKKNQLLASTGNLNYPLFIDTTGQLVINHNSNYVNYFYQPDDETLFVLTRARKSLFNYISSFSVFLSIVLLMFLVQYHFADMLRRTQRMFMGELTFTLASRVRLVTIGSVFIALLILAYTTGVYTQKKYELATEENLKNKAAKAYIYFSNLIKNKNQILDNIDLLQEQVLQFSELYESDIDVFDKQGKLLASSQRLLYQNGILEEQIDGDAYFEMRHQGKSLCIRNKKVGLLNYLSAYTPVFVDQKIMGYVQLPYFTRQQDLRQEQASFFVTLFNIYLVLLVILGVISAFIARNLTRPLSLITEQIKKTNLAGHNEKIAWHKADEIGLLVKEYNTMIDKLEASARQLTESKQAEAWQEMARQVAHEIKNPLTPMKLNIQQLQRAWSDKHQNLEAIFKKVTSVLISQIDILSKIASEFSSFAKMPSSKLEKLNIIEVFYDIESLYNADKQIVNLHCKYHQINISGDRDQLFRAFNNIVKNGIQAVEGGTEPQIDIAIEAGNDGVLSINISDNGSGIDESRRDKIFLPNFSTKSSGMGLGLAIVKQIIENHKGQIDFTTDYKKGTTFRILIPYENKLL